VSRAGASAVDMTAAGVTARLQRVSDIADLRAERRLYGKIDMTAAGVTARLREASELRDLCFELAKSGAATRTPARPT
jgi:hypothetical protein